MKTIKEELIMKNLWKMKMDELRAVAVELGADRNKLYGTSKQAIIVIIHELEKNAEATTTTDTTDTTKEESTMTETTTTTTTKATTKNNGWERIAKRNLKNAYNWRVGEMEIARDDEDITEKQFQNWVQTEAFDEVYNMAINNLYTSDCEFPKRAPKEMRFATKEFCYKYLISLFKKDGYNVTAPELETKKATVKKPRAKKATKKAAEPTTIKVVLKAFTGMKIAIYTGTLKDSTITIVTKNGKEMEFNLDGTQKVDCKNPKFNNRIEVVAEA